MKHVINIVVKDGMIESIDNIPKNCIVKIEDFTDTLPDEPPFEETWTDKGLEE